MDVVEDHIPNPYPRMHQQGCKKTDVLMLTHGPSIQSCQAAYEAGLSIRKWVRNKMMNMSIYSALTRCTS